MWDVSHALVAFVRAGSLASVGRERRRRRPRTQRLRAARSRARARGSGVAPTASTAALKVALETSAFGAITARRASTDGAPCSHGTSAAARRMPRAVAMLAKSCPLRALRKLLRRRACSGGPCARPVGTTAPPLVGTSSTYCAIDGFGGGRRVGERRRHDRQHRERGGRDEDRFRHRPAGTVTTLDGRDAPGDRGRAHRHRDTRPRRAAVARRPPRWRRHLLARIRERELRRADAARDHDRGLVGSHRRASEPDLQARDVRSRQPRSSADVLPRSPYGRSPPRRGRRDAATAFSEFDRVSLYLGVFALCSLLFRRRDLAAWCDGIGFGIVAVAVVALVSRVFPGMIGRETGAAILPALTSRLSYPVGYWNGLGILCGLGLPLVLGDGDRGKTARGAGRRSRVCAAARDRDLPHVVPRSGRDRGRRRRTVRRSDGAAVARDRSATRHGRAALRSPSLSSSGIRRSRTASRGAQSSHSCWPGSPSATAAAFAALLSAPRPRDRPSRAIGWGLVSALVLILVAGAIAAHPVRRFDAFKEPPGALAVAHGDYVKAHLLSGSGSGRWQFWDAALDEFRTSAVHGRGAGIVRGLVGGARRARHLDPGRALALPRDAR